MAISSLFYALLIKNLYTEIGLIISFCRSTCYINSFYLTIFYEIFGFLLDVFKIEYWFLFLWTFCSVIAQTILFNGKWLIDIQKMYWLQQITKSSYVKYNGFSNPVKQNSNDSIRQWKVLGVTKNEILGTKYMLTATLQRN